MGCSDISSPDPLPLIRGSLKAGCGVKYLLVIWQEMAEGHSLVAKPVWVSHASCNLPFLLENPEVTQKDGTGEFWDTQTNLESRGPRWSAWEIRWEGWLYRPRVLAREQKWIAQRARWRVSILQCYKIVGFSLKNSSTVDPYASFDSHSPTTSVEGNPLLLLVQVKNLRHYLELKYPQPLGLNL